MEEVYIEIIDFDDSNKTLKRLDESCYLTSAILRSKRRCLCHLRRGRYSLLNPTVKVEEGSGQN